ncbi:hypothetical protein HNP84_007340 [Thermocatellispora tengchongensis]|uniref:Uncharacterized protein n=1 Tax=Thermocatellispora tengchongensis TaxID=1073253 RepID=A0A840PD99_9ACTN|nr:hypothetical protein [Thermocatellispora tengchongensis]MBB5137588.1 hypothetical protein [Thermocatellispora tengchongensis]
MTDQPDLTEALYRATQGLQRAARTLTAQGAMGWAMQRDAERLGATLQQMDDEQLTVVAEAARRLAAAADGLLAARTAAAAPADVAEDVAPNSVVRVLLLVGEWAELRTALHPAAAPLRVPAARIAEQAGLPANELPGREFSVRILTERDADGFTLLNDPRL